MKQRRDKSRIRKKRRLRGKIIIEFIIRNRKERS